MPLLFRAPLRRFVVAEASMEPALRAGDRLLGLRTSRFRRGDMVVFEHPRRTGFWMVKRVIGLPGETVQIDVSDIKINDRPLSDVWGVGHTSPDGIWDVGAGEVFVLSDARSATLADSRTLGPISTKGVYRSMGTPRSGL